MRGHVLKLLPVGRQGGSQRVCGRTWKFSPARLAALAPVGVEADAVFEVEVSGGHAKDLGSPAAGEDQGQDDRPVTQTLRCARNDSEESSDFISRKPAGRRGGCSRSLQLVAWVADNDVHPLQEAEER